MDTVYVLRLRGGYYYIGYTRNPNARITAHMEGRGAIWTRLHPVEEVECTYDGDQETERQVTLEYMAKYGVHKVRGGPWSQVDLQYLPRDLVQAYSQQCYNCGQFGHTDNYCQASNSDNSMEEDCSGSYPESDSESCDNEFCVRCGRSNHSYDNCNASFTRTKKFIRGRDCCSRCGRFNHWAQDCRANFDVWGNRV